MHPSIWEKETYFGHRDVIIVGSGFAGLWSALYLKQIEPRISITIVDRGIIPTGASTRNAGFACFGSVTELMEDVRTMGEDKTVELAELRFRGLNRINDAFKKKSISLDFCGGYELITQHNELSKKELKQQIKWLNDRLGKTIGKKKIYPLADDKIAGFGFRNVTHLVQNRLEGYLHPGKLCESLLRKVRRLGITVLNSVEITGFDNTSSDVTLYTNQHISLSASKVLICANVADTLLPDLAIQPARGQVLLTSEIPDLKFKGTFHYDSGYYYFRNVGKRLLLGGARNKFFAEENTAELITTENVQKELEGFLATYLLPNTPYEVTDRWSGTMGMGPTKFPIAKEASQNVFCAVGMGGMGLALAPVVGEKAAKIVLG